MGLLGAGEYPKLVIDSIQVVEHKIEGEPKIMIRLTDVDTQDSITDYLYTSNAAWDAVTQPRLKAYGWDPAANSYAISQLHNSETLVGTEVGPVSVKEEMYEGKLHSKVANVGAFVARAADPGMLAAAEAKLRARLAPGAPRKAAPKKPIPVAVTTPIADDAGDDIPF